MSDTAFVQDNLVSSRPEDDATLLDPSFINAWGIALRPAGLGGHWWVTNTDTSRVTLYVGDSPTVPFGADGLQTLGVPGAPGDPTTIVITPPTRDGVPLPAPSPTPATVMPPSNPTGQVFSGSATDFLVDGVSLTGLTLDDAPARFITVSEDGTIAAWGEASGSPAGRMNAFAVVVDNSTPDENGIHAIYKGVAISAETGSGNLLYAANFSQNRVDVFDAAWRPVETTGFIATAPGDRDIADYAPFNIERVFDASRGESVLIVAYAKVANAEGGEEEATDGFVAKFSLDGTFLDAGDAGGAFNAPWGVALAPAEFGDHDDALLVGNFGDGRILALDVATLDFADFLRDESGEPVVIEGLWDLAFGNGESLGATDKLYFAAGPDEETNGLFGSLAALPESDQDLRGSLVADTLRGGTGDDVLAGRDGDDTIRASRGTDDLRGGLGDDALDGGAGEDRLVGGDGADALVAGDGDDSLFGGDGADALDGGAGSDLLFGGSGADTLTGGAGNDRFRFDAASDSAAGTPDVIADFTASGADRDKINLRALDADATTAADDAFAFIGTAAFGGTAGELRAEAVIPGETWLVEADMDGGGTADFAILVTTGGDASATWFML